MRVALITLIEWLVLSLGMATDVGSALIQWTILIVSFIIVILLPLLAMYLFLEAVILWGVER